MAIVWTVFAFTALALAIGAWAAIRARGERADIFHMVGRYLFAMALVTLLFPVLLSYAEVVVWVIGYIAFIIAITVIMTASALVRARRYAGSVR